MASILNEGGELVNIQLTILVILIFSVIIGMKVLEDPTIQASVEESVEVEVQNMMQQMVGDSFNYTVFDAKELMPSSFYGMKP